MHAIEAHREVASGEEGADLLKVEQRLHQSGVRLCVINNSHLELSSIDLARGRGDSSEIDLRNRGHSLKLGNRLAVIVDGVCKRLEGWAAVGRVELDSKVVLESTWVMRGRQQDCPHARLLLSIQGADQV